MASERARYLRTNMTEAEKKLWQELRNLRTQGFHFRRQAPIGDYIVDFVCHSEKVVVEVDGGQHTEETHHQSDAKRTAWFECQGYCVIRFWNNEVNENLEGVVDIIVSTLTNHPTRTADAVHPPHQGEGKLVVN